VAVLLSVEEYQCLLDAWQVKAIEDAVKVADAPGAVFYSTEEVKARFKKVGARVGRSGRQPKGT